jgi:pyridoxal phosphate enzyme (YggS family)
MRLQSVSPEVANNVRFVRDQIAEAARICGRDPAGVHLIAVSKRKSADLIRAAHAAGVTNFGENYLQEAIPKIHSLRDLDATWHFIGAIQSNKTKLIAENFHWVHTLSTEKTARRLSDQCPLEKTLDVCLQVNIDQDPNKAGVATDQVRSLLDFAGTLPRLRVRGLMTVLQQHSNPADGYRRLATLWEGLKADGGQHWDTLSMGMSGDFRVAISAGATHVRIGTAVFGDRN